MGGNSHDRRKLERAEKSQDAGSALPKTADPPAPTAMAEIPQEHTKRQVVRNFLESPFLWGAIGLVGGIMATILYGWILVFSGLLVFYAFWRSGIVPDKPRPRQFVAYGVLIVITSGILYACYVKINVLRSDVSISDIRFVPETPVTVEIICENESNVLAETVGCFTGLYLVPTENRKVSHTLQESLYSDFQIEFQKESSVKFADLSPHKTRSGFKTIAISQDDSRALSLGTKAFFIPTLIFWKDDFGLHKREVCHWMQPPDSLRTPIVQTHFPLCDDHNRRLY